MAYATPVERPSYPGLAEEQAKLPRNVSRTVTEMRFGQLSVIADFAVTSAMATPITLQDSRINPLSYIDIMTINVAGDANNTDWFVVAVREGEVDIVPTKTGWASRSIRALILG